MAVHSRSHTGSSTVAARGQGLYGDGSTASSLRVEEGKKGVRGVRRLLHEGVVCGGPVRRVAREWTVYRDYATWIALAEAPSNLPSMFLPGKTATMRRWALLAGVSLCYRRCAAHRLASTRPNMRAAYRRRDGGNPAAVWADVSLLPLVEASQQPQNLAHPDAIPQ